MRCTSCQHALWNLTGNTCPECGTLFSRSQYDFQPYSVMFKCPSCAQPYYGAGEKGHLVPTEFECQGCHAHVSMESCVLVPVPGRENDAIASGVPVPWTTDAGFFKRLWDTTIAVLISPRSIGVAIAAHEPRLKSAFTFFVVVMGILFGVSLICIGGQGIFMFLMMGGLASVFGGVSAMPSSVLLMSQLGPGLVMTMGAPLIYGSYVPVAAAIAIGIWRVFGGETGRDTQGGANLSFSRAVEILLWSSGTLLVSLVPCCIGYFAAIWWTVSAAIIASAFASARVRPSASGLGAWSMVIGMLAPLFVGCCGFGVAIYFVGLPTTAMFKGGVTTFNSSGTFSTSPNVAPLVPADEDEPVVDVPAPAVP